MQKNLGHKIYLLWSNEKYWEGKFDIVCNIMFICPSLNLGIYVIGLLDSNLSWGGVFKIFRHLMMIQITNPSQWYQIWVKLQCVWLKKQVIAPMSVRAGGAGGCHRPPSLPLGGNSDFLGSKRNFGKTDFAKVSMFRLLCLFFLWKRYFFIWGLSRRGKFS